MKMFMIPVILIASTINVNALDYRPMNEIDCDFLSAPVMRRGTGIFDRILFENIIWSIQQVGGKNFDVSDRNIEGVIFEPVHGKIDISYKYNRNASTVLVGRITKYEWKNALDNLSRICHNPEVYDDIEGCEESCND